MRDYERKSIQRLGVGGIVFLVFFGFLVYGVGHYREIRGALGLDTAAVQQIRTESGMRYLYLNDGTVWLLGPEEPRGAPVRFFALPGDAVRFRFAPYYTWHISDGEGAFLPGPPKEAWHGPAPGDFTEEHCTIEIVTRPQNRIVAMRVAGDPKRDSCPAQ